ncbi:MAG: hypothetical protein P8J27_10635 [Mariniblastus sp.]|nr:hypothetical protein [Mariniblastus sp.]
MPQEPNRPNFEREKLIEMVREIQNASACIVDFDGMLNRLEEKLGNRQIGVLIFDPPGGTPLTAEQIIDRVLGNS